MVSAIAYANGDDCFPVRTHPRMGACRGFSLRRSIRHPDGSTADDVLDNFVGFEADQPTPHEHRPSTEWPLQRYTWTDHLVGEGDVVSYTITPVIRANGKLPASAERCSDRRSRHDHVDDVHAAEGGLQSRIVLSQFVASHLPVPFSDADLRVQGGPRSR